MRSCGDRLAAAMRGRDGEDELEADEGLNTCFVSWFS